MKIDVYNRLGKVVDKADMKDDVFGVPLNQSLLHQALVMYQANKRQGTNSTKTRAEVAGGGRKPWRQKGTGRARQGSIRAPHWRKGGVAFGPKPRDYRKAMPKKMRRLAIRCALSSLVRNNRLIVLEDLNIEKPKTSGMVNVLEALGVQKSALIVTTGQNLALNRATRNIVKTKVLMADLLNVLDLVKYANVVITVDAIRRAEVLWSVDSKKTGAEPVIDLTAGTKETKSVSKVTEDTSDKLTKTSKLAQPERPKSLKPKKSKTKQGDS